MNIELNYFDGTNYTILYPTISWDNNSGGTISTTNIPSLDASKITSGTFTAARIPSLAATKITSGTFASTSGEYIFPTTLRLKNSTNYGMKLNFGDGDYVYLYEDSDDNLTIKAKRIEFTTSASIGLTNNGVAIGGSSGAKAYTGKFYGTNTDGPSVAVSGYPLLFVANIEGIAHYSTTPLVCANLTADSYACRRDVFSPIFYQSNVSSGNPTLQSSNNVMWRVMYGNTSISWTTYYNGNTVSSSSLDSYKWELCLNSSSYTTFYMYITA